MARHEHEASQTTLPQPLRSAASVLQRVPGAGLVSRAAGGALDKVGAVSPRGRRLAVYTGAGVLGVAGVVEWPVAVTGAAVAWLTQPRPHERDLVEADTPTDEATGTPPDAVPEEGRPETRGGGMGQAPADELGEVRASEVREMPSGDVGTTPGLDLGSRTGTGTGAPTGGSLAETEPVTAESEPLPGPQSPEPGEAESTAGRTGADSEESDSGTAPSGPAIS
jgi:hypothetical protein